MMIKKILVSGFVLIVLVAAAAGVYHNAKATGAQPEIELTSIVQPITQTSRWGQTNDVSSSDTSLGQNGVAIHQDAGSSVLPAPGDLSQEEADALLYMVEEEKLARDIYNALYAIWGSPTFSNIAASEQTHMDAIKNLLAIYDLSDPSSSQAGVFNNSDLQALYDQLVERGSQTLAEAFKVGAAIEEIDILDLQESLGETDNADIQQVFNNLLRASGSHLRAFINALQMQTGEVYQPQHLGTEAYEAILSGSSGGFGSGAGVQGGGRQGGRGGRGG
jgi:hypothetical protein